MTDIIASELDDDMKNSWGTDPRVFNALNKEFNFALDVAASHENHKCPMYYTKDDDALSIDWSKALKAYGMRPAWSNPPYGRGLIKRYFDKSIEQKAKGVTSVHLVPATLDAQWLTIDEISEIRVITGGRLTFIAPCDYVIKGKNGKPDRYIKKGDAVAGNTKGSMIVIFRPSKMPLSVRLIDRDELIAEGEG